MLRRPVLFTLRMEGGGMLRCTIIPPLLMIKILSRRIKYQVVCWR